MKTPDDIIAIANALAKVPYAPRIIVGNITFEPNFVVFLLLAYKKIDEILICVSFL